MDSLDIQKDIMQFWESCQIHQKLNDLNKCNTKLTIYDGPPFPTGPPHHGHMMTSVVKDTVIRYLMSTGNYVPRKIGWDMFGNHVDSKYNEYIASWIDTMKAIGRWVDVEDYRTSSKEYIESVWWVFKTLFNKDYMKIYTGLTPYCYDCNRPYSDFEKYQNIGTIKEQTIYYTVDIADSNYKLMIWEMMPWTIPNTIGYAMNPNIKYMVKDNIIASEKYVSTLEDADTWCFYDIKQSDMITAEIPTTSVKVPIYWTSELDPEKGTGIMKLSPTLDIRSLNICEKLNITYSRDPPPIVDANIIISELELTGNLVKIKTLERQVHTCPHCNNRLIKYPVKGIYYSIESQRNSIEKSLDSIYWEPRESKRKIIDYNSTAENWLITRNKNNGIPVPLWFDDNNNFITMGSYAELKEYTDYDFSDNLPNITYNNSNYSWCKWRFDHWFDSACMPYGSVGYPFKTTKMEYLSSIFPCLLSIEGVDQLHGWFYATNVISSGLFNKAAFVNIITNGLVMNNNIKMSKSKNPNSSEVMDIVNKYGVDSYRIYLMQNRLLSGINFNFCESNISTNFVRNLKSLLNFLDKFEGFIINTKFKASRITDITDNWILQSLDNYLEEYHSLMKIFKVARSLSLSVQFFSSIKKYITLNKQRLLAMKDLSVSVLIRVILNYLQTLSPFIPFTTEYMFKHLKSKFNCISKSQSIHHMRIPEKQWRKNTHFLESARLMFTVIDAVNKTQAQKVSVYIEDLSLVKPIKEYVANITKKDVTYSDAIGDYVKASVEINYDQKFTDKDHKIFNSLTLSDIIKIDHQGYYINSEGDKTYPGQYVIKYKSTVKGIINSGVFVIAKNQEHQPSSVVTDILNKGQYLGKRLMDFIKQKYTGERFMIYIDHPPLSDVANESYCNLVKNINKYTLPFVNQNVFSRNGKTIKSFDCLELTVWSSSIAFHLVSIDLGLDR
jgi:isoleucyl-tRNA synthetase